MRGRLGNFSFYMYTQPSLDHTWLRDCPKFEAMRNSALNERLAEVEMRELLANDPRRTYDPAQVAMSPIASLRSHVLSLSLSLYLRLGMATCLTSYC